MMQDRTPLFKPKDLGSGKGETLELAQNIHTGSETAGAVVYWKRIKLICATPSTIGKFHPTTGAHDCLRNGYISMLRNFNHSRGWIAAEEPFAGKCQRRRATIHRHRERRSGVFTQGGFKVLRDLVGVFHGFFIVRSPRPSE